VTMERPAQLAYQLFKEDGSRHWNAERELAATQKIRDEYEKKLTKLAQIQQQVGKQEYIPPDDASALEMHRAAQRRAAAMSDDILTALKELMLNASRPTVRLDAAKALWEIAGRALGGNGKAGAQPGDTNTTFIVVDKTNMMSELEKRRKDGTL
jgi:hypothetical protein